MSLTTQLKEEIRDSFIEILFKNRDCVRYVKKYNNKPAETFGSPVVKTILFLVISENLSVVE